jgi:diguanylate cyclase (GGDEF)-like protein
MVKNALLRADHYWMRPEPAPMPDRGAISAAGFADACHRSLSAVRAAQSARAAVEAALSELHDGLDGAFVSLFALEHGRLWMIGQRGYSVIPDGISIEQGVTGRAIRLGETQFVTSVAADPDYVAAFPGVASELAVPLQGEYGLAGLLNVETAQQLPAQAPKLVRKLSVALGPAVAELRAARRLDVAALAQLFVYQSSVRDPLAIAEIAAASLSRILSLESVQLFVRADDGSLEQLALSRTGDAAPDALPAEGVDRLLASSDRAAPFVVVDAREELERANAACAVLVPLRANGHDLGVLVGTSPQPRLHEKEHADLAALLGAHAAASLDAALSLGRERRSALTDPLTGLLNRRGFEQLLDDGLAQARETRRPLSLLVLDCDDFKEINDRAGHEFGDALLAEIGRILPTAIPFGAGAARLGGDEFVVMLRATESEAADTAATEVRMSLAAGLDASGFPVRISAGLSTYPYDGGAASQLLRAADQALYEAKAAGKDRHAAYRDVVRQGAGLGPTAQPAGRRQRRDAAVLADAGEAALAIWSEVTVDGVLDRLCRALTFVIGATGCAASLVKGNRLFDVARHTLRDVSLGADATYLIDDFPLTKETLASGRSRAISFLDEDLDRAEAFILRELGMNACLLVPLVVAGKPWGLVELYEARMRRYARDEEVVADFLGGQASRRIEQFGDVEPPPPPPPLRRYPNTS